MSYLLNFLFLSIIFCGSYLCSRGQVNFNTDPSVLRDPSGYKLRIGDRIKMTVRGEPDCQIDSSLANDGKVEFPYIGEVVISGLSTKDAAAALRKKYQTDLIFRNPIVSVSVTKYSERVVFLTGSVNRKGPYVLPPEVEAMNIVEVISRAGGFSDIARKNKVFVTRTFFDSNGKPLETKTYEVDVEGLSNGSVKFGNSRRFWIYPGDRIQVPERLI